jgi:hypothetical protein
MEISLGNLSPMVSRNLLGFNESHPARGIGKPLTKPPSDAKLMTGDIRSSP